MGSAGKRAQAVVVGGGLAGISAAIRLAEHGVPAVLLERSAEDGGGGNARVAGGLLHVCWQAMDDDPAHLYATVMDVTDGEADPALAEALCARAAGAVEWLRGHGVEVGARDATPHLRHVLLPHSPSTGVRRDHDRGPDRAMRRLYELARTLGVDVRLATDVRALHRAGDAWEVVAQGDGGALAWTAEHVVVADGGFQANRELLARYVGPAAEQALLRATPSSTGRGLRMLLDAGAAAVGLGRVYGHMVSWNALQSDEFWPYPNLDGLCLAALLVDRFGRRFDARPATGIQLVNELIRTLDPRGFVAVCDDAAWRGPAAANPNATAVANPDVPARGGHHVVAGTLPELADALGLPHAALSAAVEAHNDGGPRHTVVEPPFHGLRVLPGITFTMGGARTDAQARVLDAAGQALPGLYAAGATAGGLQGGPRGGYVGGLSTALVFGLIAGETVAAASATGVPAHGVAG